MALVHEVMMEFLKPMLGDGSKNYGVKGEGDER